MAPVAMATKYGTKSAIIRLMWEISPRSLRQQVEVLNDARQILPRPTPVDMATKFNTKSAVTRLV